MTERAQIIRARNRILHFNYNRSAVLGNGQGVIRYGLGKVWVRTEAGTDSNNNTIYNPPQVVNAGVGGYVPYEGAKVRLEWDDNGQLAIKSGDTLDMCHAGIDPQILNPLLPEARFIYLRNVVRAMNRPDGQGSTTSTTMWVNPLYHDDNYGNLNYYSGTALKASKPDLSSYIPSAGYHCYAVTFLRTIDNTIQITASTEQLLTSALDLTDLQECFAQRDPETIPLTAYTLADGATGIDIRDVTEDLRQFVNMPQVAGEPNTIDLKRIIRNGQTVTHSGLLTVNNTLTVDGTLTVLSDDPLKELNPRALTTPVFTATGVSRFNDTVRINKGKIAQWYEPNNIYYVGWGAKSGLASNLNFTWPTTQGNANDVLFTDGVGGTFWSAVGGDGRGIDGQVPRFNATQNRLILTSDVLINSLGSGYTEIGDGINRVIVETDGDMRFEGNAGIPRGEIYITKGNTTATSIASSGVWYQVTQFDANGVGRLMTPDYTNAHIEIDYDGQYFLALSACCESVVLGTAAVYEFQIFKNNGATAFNNLATCRKLSGGGGDYGSISISGFVDVSDGDTLELWVKNMTNANDIIFEAANLSMFQAGG